MKRESKENSFEIYCSGGMQQEVTALIQRRKVEDYMKTIFILQKEGPVRGAYIAEQLNVNKATVSVSLKELEREGYCFRLKDRSVALTPKGMMIAKNIVERNTRIYELLVSLGISEAVASRDACRIEHELSQESFCALIALGECRARCELFAQY